MINNSSIFHTSPLTRWDWGGLYPYSSTILFQPSFCFSIVRIHFFYLVPEPFGMIHVHQMSQFMHHNIVLHKFGSHHQSIGKIEILFTTTTSPSGSSRGNANRVVTQLMLPSIILYSIWEYSTSLILKSLSLVIWQFWCSLFLGLFLYPICMCINKWLYLGIWHKKWSSDMQNTLLHSHRNTLSKWFFYFCLHTIHSANVASCSHR